MNIADFITLEPLVGRGYCLRSSKIDADLIILLRR
jgi:hypothetical protein